MANKRTRPLSQNEFMTLVDTIRYGIGDLRPNPVIATALVTEANLGMRISDILALRLTDIINQDGRYRLDVVEQKTRKRRMFTVPAEVYIYLQQYALEQGISPTQKLFPIGVRAVQRHLQKVCTYLDLADISTHSFRKYFALSIYNENGYNIELVREVLQHSSVSVTQRYIAVEPRAVALALEKHISLPNKYLNYKEKEHEK